MPWVSWKIPCIQSFIDNLNQSVHRMNVKGNISFFFVLMWYTLLSPPGCCIPHLSAYACFRLFIVLHPVLRQISLALSGFHRSYGCSSDFVVYIFTIVKHPLANTFLHTAISFCDCIMSNHDDIPTQNGDVCERVRVQDDVHKSIMSACSCLSHFVFATSLCLM